MKNTTGLKMPSGIFFPFVFIRIKEHDNGSGVSLLSEGRDDRKYIKVYVCGVNLLYYRPPLQKKTQHFTAALNSEETFCYTRLCTFV